MTGVSLNTLVVLDQGTGLITVQPRHHDIDKYQVRLMVRDLRQGVKAVDRGKYLTAFLRKQRLRRSANRLAIVDHQNFETTETSGCFI